MDVEATANFIRQRRIELGLTQKQLAEKLSVTDKAISRWETAKGLPDTSLLTPLAEILGVSVGEILSGQLIEEPQAKEKTDKIILDSLTYAKNTLTKAVSLFLGLAGTALLLCPLFISGKTVLVYYFIGVALLASAAVNMLITRLKAKRLTDKNLYALSIVPAFAAFVTELLPISAVLIFSVGPDKTSRQTCSYFEPLLWGYAHFSPPMCGILTVILLVVLTASAAKFERAKKLRSIAFIIGIVAAVFSLLSYMVFGGSYMTPAAVAITILLVISTILQSLANRRQ